MQKLDLAREKLQETNEEFDTARKKAKKTKQSFEKVKKDRHDRFMDCFEHVSNEIDGIYKVCWDFKSLISISGFVSTLILLLLFPSIWLRTSLPKRSWDLKTQKSPI